MRQVFSDILEMFGSLLIFIIQSIKSLVPRLNVKVSVNYCRQLLEETSNLQKLFGIDAARTELKLVARSVTSLYPMNLNPNIEPVLRMLANRKTVDFTKLVVKLFDDELVSKFNRFMNRELSTEMERTITQMILNTVLPRKAAPVITSITAINGSVNLSPERQSLSEILENLYERERQTHDVYQRKLSLRQKIYSLLCKQMEEKIDLFLIGSSLTHLGGNCSDTDLCLIIYDSEGKVDPKYETRDVVMSKLEELSKIFESNSMSLKAEVIPALVPILKFIETSTGIEVNINVNRVVTIRNTHLLHTYSQMDKRVAQLILIVKLWAKKNGINSAFNKSLTSYSISLMVIHFLQSVCSPPVIPCLQKVYPHLFVEDVTQLRLTNESIQFRSCNHQSLGHLFTQFFEYYSLFFNYEKVISVRSGTLLGKELLISRSDVNGRVWQWKCHICIEEPFIGTNTSHAVHDCRMFREILSKFMDTYHQIINGSFTLSTNGLAIV